MVIFYHDNTVITSYSLVMHRLIDKTLVNRGACNIPKLKIRIPQGGGHGVFATTQLFCFGQKNWHTKMC